MDISVLSSQFRDYEDKWVAISEPEERIVASADDALEAKRDAERKGYAEIILFKVLPFDAAYIPSSYA